jgi:hypothetical protein
LEASGTIGQLLEHIDPNRITSLALSLMPTSTPVAPHAFGGFNHLRRLTLTNITIGSYFLHHLFTTNSPLLKLKHISYEHREERNIGLVSLIKLLRGAAAGVAFTMRSIDISTVKAYVGSRRDNAKWVFAEWNGRAAREDMIELIRLGKERGITIGGTNVEALEIESKYDQMRWGRR